MVQQLDIIHAVGEKQGAISAWLWALKIMAFSDKK
jgi:hypothetical protein